MDAPEDLFRGFLSRLVLGGTRFIDPDSTEDRNGFRAVEAALTVAAESLRDGDHAAYKKAVRLRNIFHESNNGAFPSAEHLLRAACTRRRIDMSPAFARTRLETGSRNDQALIETALVAFVKGRCKLSP